MKNEERRTKNFAFHPSDKGCRAGTQDNSPPVHGLAGISPCQSKIRLITQPALKIHSTYDCLHYDRGSTPAGWNDGWGTRHPERDARLHIVRPVQSENIGIGGSVRENIPVTRPTPALVNMRI